MNAEIRTKAAQFLFWEYLFQIFGIVYMQCMTMCPGLRIMNELEGPELVQHFRLSRESHRRKSAACPKFYMV